MNVSIGAQAARLFCPENCICMLCGEEAVVGDDRVCEDCRSALRLAPLPAPPPEVDGLFAGLRYEDNVARAVHRFKYYEGLGYADFFAGFMHVPEEWRADILVPVPLHPLREFLRTYNQSLLLAERLSAQTRIPFCRDLIVRKRYTPPQARLSGKERGKNLRGAFQADPACRGLNLVLVDDVCTSGSTLTSCAHALKKAGAAKVYAVCAATVLR
ncbi:MAG: hypothetical protein FWE69_05795 [Clostridiales bacterium]|nr:hypothetical protein [Clostridiales bacterium]